MKQEAQSISRPSVYASAYHVGASGSKTVQTRPAVPACVPPPVAQLASDYTGLMPGHDTFGQSYSFDGGTKKDFTYHHIIPENKLEQVVDRMKEILADKPDDRELNTKKSTLETNAEKQWQQTRAVNTAHAVNGLFSMLPKGTISVTSDELLPVIKTYNTVEELLEGVKEVLRPKLRVVRDKCIQKMFPALSAMLNDPESARIIRVGYKPSITNLVEDSGMTELTKIDAYAPPIISNAEVAAMLVTESGSNSKRIEAVFKRAEALNPVNTYMANAFPYLASSANSGDTLKAKVKENAIGKSDHASDKLKYAVQWNPGNIHRGPKSDMRISGGTDFDELLDDGGDVFEKAAVNLVSSGHFESLVKLSRSMEQLLQADIGEGVDGPTLLLAKSVMDQMIAVQGMGLTGFEADKWGEAEVGSGGDRKKIARLKKDQTKIDDATHKGLLT